MKDKVFTNTAIGDVRLTSLACMRQFAKDTDYLNEYDWINVVDEFGKVHTFTPENEIADLRKCLKQSGIKAVIWECGYGETVIFGKPDWLVYHTSECERSFTLTQILNMTEADQEFSWPLYFDDYK